jgi:hypothetical protein
VIGRLAREAGVGEWVTFTGWLPEEEADGRLLGTERLSPDR